MKTCKSLLIVYINMTASNKTQMVLSHHNGIIVHNTTCDISVIFSHTVKPFNLAALEVGDFACKIANF